MIKIINKKLFLSFAVLSFITGVIIVLSRYDRSFAGESYNNFLTLKFADGLSEQNTALFMTIMNIIAAVPFVSALVNNDSQTINIYILPRVKSVTLWYFRKSMHCLAFCFIENFSYNMGLLLTYLAFDHIAEEPFQLFRYLLITQFYGTLVLFVIVIFSQILSQFMQRMLSIVFSEIIAFAFTCFAALVPQKLKDVLFMTYYFQCENITLISVFVLGSIIAAEIAIGLSVFKHSDHIGR
ncbi:MAG: hypothetical protein ACLUFN_05500 [Eubacterium sp.]